MVHYRHGKEIVPHHPLNSLFPILQGCCGNYIRFHNRFDGNIIIGQKQLLYRDNPLQKALLIDDISRIDGFAICTCAANALNGIPDSHILA